MMESSKATRIAELPAAWVPDYLVLKFAANHGSPLANVVQEAFAAAQGEIKEILLLSPDGLIVRSSALNEDFTHRGFFRSEVCASNITAAQATAMAIVGHAVERGADISSFEVIIQRYVVPKLKGHLSNERRVSEEKRSWVIEVEDGDAPTNLPPRIRAYTSEHDVEQELSANSTRELRDALRLVAARMMRKRSRYHCEWVWDGQRVYVVQCDDEPDLAGERPGAASIQAKALGDVTFRVLMPATGARTEWQKAEAVKVFSACGLAVPPVYVLETPGVIEQLAQGRVPDRLRADIELLTEAPTVIRTDTRRSDVLGEFLLPRTDAALTTDEALVFMVERSSRWANEGLAGADCAFLLHRFIPAHASAWGLASPDTPTIRIDGTWGLPDGLIFYTHDSFEWDKSGRKVTKSRIRGKTDIIDYDDDGRFVHRQVGRPWDWKHSLTPEELAEIARMTSVVADYQKGPVEVMFFVGVSDDVPILPWMLTQTDAGSRLPAPHEAHFSPVRISIRTEADLADFDVRAQAQPAWARRVALALNPELQLLRSDDFIEAVIEVATRRGCQVELEGSVLSHAYYRLSRAGVPVRAADPFEGSSRRTVYGKIVRDRIPDVIARRGETAKAYRAARDELEPLLKVKVLEEAFELFAERGQEGTTEELTDLLDVILGLADLMDLSLEGLLQRAAGKKSERGEFGEGLVLLETKTPSLRESMGRRQVPADARTEPGTSLDLREALLHSRTPILRGREVHIPLIPPPDLWGVRRSFTIKLDSATEVSISYNGDTARVSLNEAAGPEVHPEQLTLEDEVGGGDA
jgi:predicted house-cleaning noncanonical NTP pyrophosphatase (MazG superfamily)